MKKQIKELKSVSAEGFLKKFRNRIIAHRYNYKFKGWGYEELAIFYKIPHHTYDGCDLLNDCVLDERDILGEKIRCKFREVVQSGNPENEKILAKAIRDYLKAMLKFKKFDVHAPIYEAMLKLDDDGTLIKFTYKIIEAMWT